MKVLIPLLIIFVIPFYSISQTNIVVGVSENPPLVFKNEESGKATGLFIDVLEYIAQRESWTLEYRYGSFNQNLEWLEAGEIDIMPDLAFSKERQNVFLFHGKPLLNTWGTLYSDELAYEDIFDLRGNKIGYVANDFFVENENSGLRNQLNIYEVDAELIPFESYLEIAENLDLGKIDVGVFNRTFSFYLEENYDFDRQPIYFSAVGLYYAFNSSRADLIPVFDEQLANLKSKNKSQYDIFVRKYIADDPVPIVPEWIIVAVIVLTISILVLVLFIYLLRYQVKLKTQEITSRNEDVIQSIKRLKYSLHSAREGLFTYDPEKEQVYVDVNSFNVSGRSYAGKTISLQDFLGNVNEKDRNLLNPLVLKDTFEQGQIFTSQVRFNQPNNNEVWVEITAEVNNEITPGKSIVLGTMRDIHLQKLVQLDTESLLQSINLKNQELQCLYRISDLISNPAISVDETLKESVKTLSSSMTFPENVSVELILDKRKYQSENQIEPISTYESKIEVGGVEVGVIKAGINKIDDTPIEFSEEEKALIDSVATQIEYIVERQKLNEKVEMTEFNEREKIAKELHDGVQQTLTVATINLNSALEKSKQKLDEEPLSKIETSLEYLKKSTNDIRTIAHTLTLDYLQSVEKLLEDVKRNTDVEFNFYYNLNNERIPAKIEKELFRITQEAVNNIIKHSQATKASIQLMKYDDQLVLTIEDNGKGFSKNDFQDSFGLSSMRNRTHAINGIFTLDSNSKNGTSITIEIPL